MAGLHPFVLSDGPSPAWRRSTVPSKMSKHALPGQESGSWPLSGGKCCNTYDSVTTSAVPGCKARTNMQSSFG